MMFSELRSIDYIIGSTGLLFFIVTGAIFSLTALIQSITHEYARVDKEGPSKLFGKNFIKYGYWLSLYFAKLFIFLRFSPSQITWLSLSLAIIAAFFLVEGLFGVSVSLFTFAAFLDVIDGIVARETNSMSIKGELLDSMMDRYVDFLPLAACCLYYHQSPLLLSLSLLSILGTFMISYSSAKAEIKGVKLSSNLMKRPERLTIILLAISFSSISLLFESPSSDGFYTAYPLVGALIIVAVLANLSAIHRLYTIASICEQRDNAAS